MGVERAVTCWYVQRQLILADIAVLQAKREQAEALLTSTIDGAASLANINLQIVKAQEKLLSLGPCPRPMMG